MNKKVGLAILNFNCVKHCSYFDVSSLKKNSLEDPGVDKNERIFCMFLEYFIITQVRALKITPGLIKKTLTGVLEVCVAVVLACYELTPLMCSIGVSYVLSDHFINCGLVQI